MRTNKLSLFLGLILAAIVAWYLVLVFREAHLVTDHYPTRAEAQADRLFERGWLPEIVPASAFDLVVQNDLDRNTSAGSFSFSQKERPAFLAHLSETSQSGVYRYQNWIFTLAPGGEKMFYRMEPPSP